MKFQAQGSKEPFDRIIKRFLWAVLILIQTTSFPKSRLKELHPEQYGQVFQRLVEAGLFALA